MCSRESGITTTARALNGQPPTPVDHHWAPLRSPREGAIKYVFAHGLVQVGAIRTRTKNAG